MKNSFLRLWAVFSFVTLAGFAYAWPALAQTGGVVPLAPMTALTPTTIVIGVLGAIAAVITNVKNSGAAPVTWLPYLTMGGSFIAAFVASIASASSVAGVAIFNAALAGIYAVLGAASGSALHLHFSLPHMTKTLLKVGGKGAAALLPLALTGGIAFGNQGCSTLQALVPEAVAIENKVVSDLATGDTDTQIVNDVETLLGASATIEEASDVTLAILNELLASNLLAKHYPNAVESAQAIQSKLAAAKAARK